MNRLFAALFFTSALNGEPVSYHKDIAPILKRTCTGCHHPGKMKGDLDLTTHAAFAKGGKHGASFKPGDPKNSSVLEEISGKEPSMPKEGDPLTATEVALIEKWITEGAKDDTPERPKNKFTAEHPPIYTAPGVISTLAFSPGGELLAVSGYHEVLLWKADGSELAARLIGGAPRVESIAFSHDGKLLAVSGGAPSLFGEVQIWDVEKKSLTRTISLSTDSIYGVSFSPDGTKVACGGADKSVRLLNVADGKELFKFDNHSDWVFGTTFTVDGKRVLSGSRDRAMKLIDASNAQLIDDINKLLEPVYTFARHPKEDTIAYGGELGGVRIYKMKDNQERTAANRDINLVREFEKQPAAVHAICYSPDGTALAVAGAMPDFRIYNTSNGTRIATCKVEKGATFALSAHPKEDLIAAGGFDGSIRFFNWKSGELKKIFTPFPTKGKAVAAAQSRP